jgi:PleD family two-component response regulator
MTTATKKLFISFMPSTKEKDKSPMTFFERAQKHIFKAKKGGRNLRNLSRDVDKIVYGV